MHKLGLHFDSSSNSPAVRVEFFRKVSVKIKSMKVLQFSVFTLTMELKTILENYLFGIIKGNSRE